MFTEFGQVVGTLEYMSPEQAKLNALDIDTRSAGHRERCAIKLMSTERRRSLSTARQLQTDALGEAVQDRNFRTVGQLHQPGED